MTHRERKRFFRFAALDIVINFLDILSLAILLLIIHIYTQGGDTSIRGLPDLLTNTDPVILVSVVFILFAVKNFFAFKIYQSQYRLGSSIATRVSGRNLLHYLEGSYSDYVSIDTSANIRRISYQPLEFAQYVLTGIQQLITQSALIVFTVTAILVYNADLFLLLAIVLLPPVVIVAYLIRKRLQDLRVSAKANSESSLQHLKEALTGYVEANTYGRNSFFLQRYMSFQQRFNKQLADALIVQGLPHRIIEVFAVLGLFILVTISSTRLYDSDELIITIGAFMAAAYKIIPGMVKILNTSAQMKAYEFTLQSIAGEEARLRQHKNNAEAITSILVNDVSFGYDETQVLKQFNLELQKGDFIAIAGASGNGKTTVINLLLGFLQPGAGVIRVNGEPTSGAERQAYWPRISYVKQEAFILHDTILRNITLDDNEPDTGKLKNALLASGLDELLRNDTEGLQKLIAEDGKNISGGQRQRIALARAMYKSADLIILDEPFNELDDASEMSIIRHFREQANEGKMVILISHNKQSLSLCDKIISVDE